MTRRLRVGLLSFAHVHAPGVASTLGALEAVDFVGIHDEEQERGRAAAGTHGTRWHPTLEGRESLVTTSTNPHHRRYTEAAARARVHVLCEKPLATTAPDARAMIDACRAAGVQLGTAFPVRSSPALMALKDAIAAGAL